MIVDRAIGIDLGTTNSEVALLDPSERDLVLYADRFGRKTVPSALAWDETTSTFLIGHAARARRGRVPAPIESIKRKMGQSARTTCGPYALTPEEVSSKLLRELAERMQRHLADAAPEGVIVEVTRAVITVPAYFDAPQVDATRKAAELAGLTVLGILHEPTAAAIYHTWKSRLGDGVFLVYDLGGGTFDVSILRCIAGEVQVLAIDGDNYLGGDDFDRRYAEHLRKELVRRGYRLDLDLRGDASDLRRFSRIVHLAQERKEALSTAEVVHVSKQDLVDDQQGEPISFEVDVGRVDYEQVIGELVERTLACCERALVRSHDVAAVGIADIDHVIVVGGSTRVPLVLRRVTEVLCARSRAAVPLKDEVDTCVALGAAVHAAQLGGLQLTLPERKTRIAVTTPLVAESARMRLGLRVEERPSGASFLELVGADGPLARVALPVDPSNVLRLDLNLGADRESPVKLRLISDAKEVLSELSMTLYRGDVRPRASALSQLSVVAKDLGLEVVRAGRRERRVLIARGAGLPAEIAHRFYTSDQSGAVVLRIDQGRLPIKTLLVHVPTDLAIGTAVDLTLICDQAMHLEVRAEIAGQTLWAQLDAPEEGLFDPCSAVERLLVEAEAVGPMLWGAHADAYRREAETLISAIREVVRIDPDTTQALCQRLRHLIDEFQGGPNETLSPPMHRLEAELDQLRRLVYRASGALLGRTHEQWEACIVDLASRARVAYESANLSVYRRIFNEVQALYETAVEEEFSTLQLDDPAYLARRRASVSRSAVRVDRALADFVPSASTDLGALQLAERERLVAWLRDKVLAPLADLDADPVRQRRQLEQLSAELDRLDESLARIGSLGLVSDRGVD